MDYEVTVKEYKYDNIDYYELTMNWYKANITKSITFSSVDINTEELQEFIKNVLNHKSYTICINTNTIMTYIDKYQELIVETSDNNTNVTSFTFPFNKKIVYAIKKIKDKITKSNI